MAKKEEIPQAPETPTSSTPAETVQQLEPNKDARTMAMLCHLLAIFTSFVGPLIIWLIKKEQSPYVDKQGKEALNFQITVVIASFVAGLLTLVCIGFILLPAIFIVDLIFCIMGCVATNKGQDYRYPVSLRFIK
jgi:uncharacterized Tic20 family protein